MPYYPPPAAAAAHPDLTAHDTLGLTTQAELDAHAATSHGAPLGNAAPLALGTAAAGTGTSASREDHVHPTTGLARLAVANAFTVGGHTITAEGPTVVPLTLKAAASHTANVAQWQDSAGVNRLFIDSTFQHAFRATGASGGGPIYFGAFDNPNGNRAGFSVPGNAILAIDGAALRVGIGRSFAGADPTALLEVRGSQAAEITVVVRAAAAQTANRQEWQDSAGGVNTTISENGYFTTRKTTAPADAELAAGEVALWFDATNGAANAKLMIKGKQNDGTVVTGSVPLT